MIDSSATLPNEVAKRFILAIFTQDIRKHEKRLIPDNTYPGQTENRIKPVPYPSSFIRTPRKKHKNRIPIKEAGHSTQPGAPKKGAGWVRLAGL